VKSVFTGCHLSVFELKFAFECFCFSTGNLNIDEHSRSVDPQLQNFIGLPRITDVMLPRCKGWIVFFGTGSWKVNESEICRYWKRCVYWMNCFAGAFIRFLT